MGGAGGDSVRGAGEARERTRCRVNGDGGRLRNIGPRDAGRHRIFRRIYMSRDVRSRSGIAALEPNFTPSNAPSNSPC